MCRKIFLIQYLETFVRVSAPLSTEWTTQACHNFLSSAIISYIHLQMASWSPAGGPKHWLWMSKSQKQMICEEQKTCMGCHDESIALPPYLMPFSTGKASWCVRGSFLLGYWSNTEGQITTRPRFGWTVIPNLEKWVPPPCSTSLRYKKTVMMRTPCDRSKWKGM